MKRRWRHLHHGVVLSVAALCAVNCGGATEAKDVPPTIAVIGSISASLVSGSSATIVVTATDRKGNKVAAPTVGWQSSAPAIASVTSTGLVTGALVGNSTITATYDGVSASVLVAVTPGPPALLAVRTQPAGASAGVAFATQPVIELRDQAGNVASGSSPIVTASLASGGGTLGGTLTALASNGVATFSSLSLDGAVGARALSFSAGGLPAVTSASFTLLPGAPAQLVVRTQPNGATAGTPLTTQPVVELRDASGNLTIGANLPVTASVASGGGTLAGALSVNSIGGVATFSTLIVNGLIGTRTLSFTAPGATAATSAPFTLVAGAAFALGVRTLPTSGGLNGLFVPVPVVEVRDVGGNVATSSSASVTAAITAGGGTLSGATVTAASGVANFSALTVNGTPGTRTLTFSASGLTSAALTLRPCDPARAPQVDLGVSSRVLSGFAAGLVVVDSLRVADKIGSCTLPAGLQVSVTPGTGGNWLSASLVGAQAFVELRVTPGALATGSYTATLTLSSANAGSVSVPITLSIQPTFPVTYGTADQKLVQVDPAASIKPSTVVKDNAGATVTLPVLYQSRSPNVASVSSDGTITGRVEGQAWIVARVNNVGGLTDSVFANVTRGPGPLLRTDATRIVYERNSNFSITVLLDTRGATIGAAQVVFTWPSNNDNPGLLRFVALTPGTVGNPTISADLTYGTARIAIASATGVAGVITLARFDFIAASAGSSQFTTRFIELLAPDQSSLLDRATALLYPVIVK